MHRIKSLKLELKGDYQIWLIVLVLNLFGLLVQFSAKGRIAMMSPWDPITSFLKTIIILGISFYLMAYFSRQNYIKLAKFSEIALLASWVLS